MFISPQRTRLRKAKDISSEIVFVAQAVITFVYALNGRFVHSRGYAVINISSVAAKNNKTVVAQPFQILGNFELSAVCSANDVRNVALAV